MPIAVIGNIVMFAVASTGLADQRSPSETSRGGSRETASSSSGDRSSDRESSSKSSQSSSQGSYRLGLDGWTRIAYDFDRDGTWDAYEYIFDYDLQRARNDSDQRRNGKSQSGGHPAESGQSQKGQRAPEMHKLKGQISNLRTIQLSGEREDHLLGKLSSNDGRQVKVDLGPVSRFDRVNLRNGDQVTVFGTRGAINGRNVLMAARVETDEQSITINRPRNRSLSRIQGEVVSTRVENFRGHNHSHLIARVETDSGQTVTVDLGPREEFRQVNLSSGDRVDTLARQGRIDGETAWIAEQVRTNGRTFNVDQLEDINSRRTQASAGS